MDGDKTLAKIGYMSFVKADAVETDNADTCLANGWYWIKENAQGCPINRAPLFVVGAKDCIWQCVFDSQSDSALRRHTADGGTVWDPWEWENPPVADGAEYRTMMRYGGKPVYARRIIVGTAPDSAIAVYPHGLESIVPVGWEGIATDGEAVLPLPFCNHFTVGVDRTNITLSTTENYSGYTVEITLRYCKEED
ncbi:MAG: hypothetical protein IKK11_04735 [Oscillospiraceae bacterium]|nr:hypothetical protein [Oscillospiraceae bacterium]